MSNQYLVQTAELIDADKIIPRQGFLEDQLIMLTFSIYEKFRETEHPIDCMGLYVHYYYTAKWQKTNMPWSTTAYTAKALRCSVDKVRKTKKILIDLGLIEDITRRDNEGKIKGHYIKIKYIFKKDTIKQLITEDTNNHTMEIPQGGHSLKVDNGETNALSLNTNTLKVLTKNIYTDTQKDSGGNISTSGNSYTNDISIQVDRKEREKKEKTGKERIVPPRKSLKERKKVAFADISVPADDLIDEWNSYEFVSHVRKREVEIVHFNTPKFKKQAKLFTYNDFLKAAEKYNQYRKKHKKWPDDYWFNQNYSLHEFIQRDRGMEWFLDHKIEELMTQKALEQIAIIRR